MLWGARAGGYKWQHILIAAFFVFLVNRATGDQTADRCLAKRYTDEL